MVTGDLEVVSWNDISHCVLLIPTLVKERPYSSSLFGGFGGSVYGNTNTTNTTPLCLRSNAPMTSLLKTSPHPLALTRTFLLFVLFVSHNPYYTQSYTLSHTLSHTHMLNVLSSYPPPPHPQREAGQTWMMVIR